MILAALLLAVPQAQDLKCPHRPGMPADPVIRDEDTAREVFAAIADQFAGGEDWSGMEIHIAGGDGARAWTLYHYRPGQRGGGMTMTIDRCTGAVSKLHYQR